MPIPPFSTAPTRSLYDIRQLTPLLYKPEGLTRWFQSWGRLGPGLGGVDIVLIGDSIMEGYIHPAGEYAWNKWGHRLKVKMQKALNPISVPGGYGFMPARQGNDTDHWTLTGTWVKTDPSNSTAARSCNAAFGAQTALSKVNGTSTYMFAGNDANAAYCKKNLTSLDIVARQSSSGGIVRIDVSEGADPVLDAGVKLKATINTNNASVAYGVRYPSSAWTVSSGDVAFNRAADNRFLISAPSSSGNLFWDGVIAYDGDENAGVRVHDVSNHGSMTTNYAAGSNTLIASLDRFGDLDDSDTTTVGARRAKLVVFDWITNDMGLNTPTTVPFATFIANYGAQIDQALALPSKPSVLLYIPPPGGSGTREANYPEWVRGIKSLAATRSNVTVLDMWSFLGNEPRSGLTTSLNWAADHLHFTPYYQEALATLVSQILLGGKI